MAIVWEKICDDSIYKVTKAGNAIRLYRNNVLHSQWNPSRPVTGKLWELFLFASIGTNQTIKKALVLGAGGGAIVNLIHHFYPHANVDAIDLDKTHINVAKRYFRVSRKYCQLIEADVDQWLNKNKKDKYDLVIDDVFFEKNNIPYRSIDVQKKWLERILAKVNSKGMVVINYADKKEWDCSYKQIKNVRKFAEYHIGVGIQKSCDNRIVFLSKSNMSVSRIKENLCTYAESQYLRYWQRGEFSYKQLR